MAEEIRRRRRRISSSRKPEEQKPLLPVEDWSSEGRTKGERRRRRRRISSSKKPEEQKPSGAAEESIRKTEREEVTNQGTIAVILVIKQEIDDVRAEFGEERSSELVEPNYGDETHSWESDDDEASDE